MDDLTSGFNALFGGFFTFFEEFTKSYYYAFPTLIASTLLTLIIYLMFRKLTTRLFKAEKSSQYAAWLFAGAVAGGATAIIRIGLPYKAYVEFLAGIDAFGLRHLFQVSYLLFAVSGAVAGLVIAYFSRGIWTATGGIIGLVLGVLYDLQVAQGRWSASPLAEFIKCAGQAFAPAVAAFLVLKYFNWLENKYRKGLGQE